MVQTCSVSMFHLQSYFRILYWIESKYKSNKWALRLPCLFIFPDFYKRILIAIRTVVWIAIIWWVWWVDWIDWVEWINRKKWVSWASSSATSSITVIIVVIIIVSTVSIKIKSCHYFSSFWFHFKLCYVGIGSLYICLTLCQHKFKTFITSNTYSIEKA